MAIQDITAYAHLTDEDVEEIGRRLTALEKKHGWRVDYSFNALTTQSEATLEILAGLKHPVHIYALFTKGQEDGPLMELLDR